VKKRLTIEEAFGGKIKAGSKSNILTPKKDKCKMRLEPFSEDTKMVPPASRGVTRVEK